MSETRQKTPRIRETGQNTLTAFHGSFGALADEISAEETKQRTRTYSEAHSDEIIAAIRALGSIERSVTVIDGPSGCGAAKLEAELQRGSSPWLITNLDENDSILGGDAKLREAIERAFRLYSPEIIFVLATPVVAINNDDIQSVVAELSDTLDIPVVPVYAAGFKSRAAVYGYDLAYHALAKHLLRVHPANPGTGEFLTIIGTAESHSAAPVLHELQEAGIPANLLAGTVSLQALRKAVHAKASLALTPDSSRFLQHELERAHGVAALQAAPPIGAANTEAWLAAALEAAGDGTEAGKAYIRERSAEAQATLARFRLEGRKAFIDLPLEQAAGIADLVAELGGSVAGIAVPHAGLPNGEELRRLQDKWPEAAVYVQQGQAFEKLNLLKKLAPDLYIGLSEGAVWAARAGIAAAALDNAGLYGFAAAEGLAARFAKALANPSLSGYIAGKAELSYQDSWLKRSAGWHVKMEVR